ncbi:cytochrome [Ruegeria marisrubri]|uniref:Cytochrome n=1 Tax=Ruegeria marisrubri TaxID=1685379 RepID=A0A0X3TYL6_9RHOB|nr:cytochrome b/b6 domain-containing protein [Ruegeria marisrubri]KUJ80732.1 cytochrome [Ruegeria marisrubri]
MSFANTASSYGSVTKTFHWLTALLILTVIPLGWAATNMAEAVNDPSVTATAGEISRTALVFSLHKTVGVLIFFVALARILWAMTQAKPGLLNAENKPEALAAEAVHWLLYGSLVLVPLTGWVHHAATEGFAPILLPIGQDLPLVPKSQNLADITAGLHWVFQWVLVASLALHILGAIKHHVIDRDATLRRMLPGHANAPEPPAQQHGAGPALAALAVWGLALGAGAYAGTFATHQTSSPATVALKMVQSDWQVQDGSLSITVGQLGTPVTGQFADWTAAITFDEPDAPGPAGHVEVTVAIGSLTLGTVTDQAMSADFFAVSEFPTATFKGEIVKTESGYEARGPLTIRDRSVDIVLPFTLDLADGTATMSGNLVLDRLDFGIGQNMPDESSLAFAVEVGVELTAIRQPEHTGS